jgi:hypothetical protein
MWLWRFDTLSDAERLHRAVRAQKFYATLPSKIDRAIEEASEVIDLELEREKRRPKYSEELKGQTPLGGYMQIKSRFNDDEDPDPAA